MSEIKPKILLVDDRAENIFALKQTLKSLDADLIEAYSGEEALSMVLRHEFALILLDVQMPGMDGFETASFIRENAATSHIPIIFVTAISKEDKYVFKGYDVGGVDYLYKPIDPDILKNKVKVFLELYQKQQQLKTALGKVERLNYQQQLLLKCAGEGIIGLDLDGRIAFANPAACHMLDEHEDFIVGKVFKEFILKDEFMPEKNGGIPTDINVSQWQSNCIYSSSDTIFLRADGQQVPVEYTAAALSESGKKVHGGVIIFQDISDRKEVEKQLVYMAKYDHLTGVANRRLFKEFLEDAIARAERHKRYISLLFIDLDHFKDINDTLGHDIGDLLLMSVANRLKASIRKVDLVARLGGDEFAIVLDDITNEDDGHLVANKILNILTPTHQLAQHQLYLTPSIGVSTYPKDGRTPDTLIKAADKAMYVAKNSGRNGIRVFENSMMDEDLERAQIEQELRIAIEQEQFTLFYQPFVNAETHQVQGAEALIRWFHPVRGMIPPDEFIPIAEESGLIKELGYWVAKRACNDAKNWGIVGNNKNFILSINVSVRQICDSDFIQRISEILLESQFPSNALELELTESTLMTDPEETRRVLDKLKQIGLKVAIDDFGTGYSSLSYLRYLPLDTLKIDRVFIKDIGRDKHGEAIIKTTIMLAHSLNLRVVAEGVETLEQANFLRELNCEVLQGYYFYRPAREGEYQKEFLIATVE